LTATAAPTNKTLPQKVEMQRRLQQIINIGLIFTTYNIHNERLKKQPNKHTTPATVVTLLE